MLYDYANEHDFFDPFIMHSHVMRANGIPTFNKGDSAPEYVSPLLHELTHHDCMRTDFGVALAVSWFSMRETLREIGTDTKLKTSDGHELPMNMGYMFAIKRLSSLFEAIPILEGLAIFAQLDVQPNRESELVTSHWGALLALAGAGRPVEAEQESIERVFQLGEKVRSYNLYEKRLFQQVHFGASGRKTNYLFGYVFIKSLEAILIQKDERFRDSELTYIFLKSLLFNGADFRENVLNEVGGFMFAYPKRLALLQNAHPMELRVLVDMLFYEPKIEPYFDPYSALTDTGEMLRTMPREYLPQVCSNESLDWEAIDKFLKSHDYCCLKHTIPHVFALGSKEVPYALLLSQDCSYEVSPFLDPEAWESLSNEITKQGKRVDTLGPAQLTKPRLEEAHENLEQYLRIHSMIVCDPNPSSFELARINSWNNQFTNIRSFEGGGFIAPPSERLLEIHDELNFHRRVEATDFIYDIFRANPFPRNPMDYDFALFVFQNLMNLEHGGQFAALRENGFATLRVSGKQIEDFCSNYDPRAKSNHKVANELNSVLKYSFY